MTLLLMGLMVGAVAALLTRPLWRAAPPRRETQDRPLLDSRLEEIREEAVAGVLAPDQEASSLRDAQSGHDAPDTATLHAGAAPRLAAMLSVALLFASGGWYHLAGSWRTQSLHDLSAVDPEAAQRAAWREALRALRGAVAADPQDAAAWAELGIVQMHLERYDDAAQALARANGLDGHLTSDWLVAEGEARTRAADGTITVAAIERFEKALENTPAQPRALWFLGAAAFQRGDSAAAHRHWSRLAEQALPGDVAAALARSLDTLGAMAADAGEPLPHPTTDSLNVEVSLRPDLADHVTPQAVLYVLVRDAEAPGPPLAVRKLPARFPRRVTLRDADAMVPDRTLSSARRWEVVARVSLHGGPMARPGDLEGVVTLAAGSGDRVAVQVDAIRQ